MTKKPPGIIAVAGARALTLAMNVGQRKPAQEKTTIQQPAMNMPKPGPEMESLNFMLGTWELNEK